MKCKRFRDTHYLVYEDGRIWSEWNSVFVSILDNGNGYMATGISLGKKGARKKIKMYVHRIVAECFLENPEGLEQVNHKNGIKGDNRVENLEWCSRRSNMNHAFANGLIPINPNNWLPKKEKVVRVLSNEDAQECRDLWFKGVGYGRLSVMYRFKVGVIRDACNGRNGYVIKGFTPEEWIERRRYLKEMEDDWNRDMKKISKKYSRMDWSLNLKIDFSKFCVDNNSDIYL